jgi:hypothetical protein
MGGKGAETIVERKRRSAKEIADYFADKYGRGEIRVAFDVRLGKLLIAKIGTTG